MDVEKRTGCRQPRGLRRYDTGNVETFSIVDRQAMTRRAAILTGFGLATAAASLPAWGAVSKGFWNEKKPSDWTPEEVQTLLTDSPWARSASISYYGGQDGPLGSLRSGGGGRRRGAGGVNRDGTPAATSSSVRWEAIVRWESALPIREAMKIPPSPDLADNYILNMVGDIPSMGADSDEDSAARQSAFEMWKEYTKLEHQGDQLTLNRVDLAPKSALSAAGTLFYFSRVLPLRLEDKQATFSTKMGPIEVKCKFTLKDMTYHGSLEL